MKLSYQVYYLYIIKIILWNDIEPITYSKLLS